MRRDDTSKRRKPTAAGEPLPAAWTDFAERARGATLDGVEEEQIVALAEEAASLPAAGASLVLEGLARQAHERALPLLVAVARLASGPLAVAAAAALGLVRHPEAVEALLHLAEGDRPKEVRKEARRSLFRLRAAGVPVPEAQRAAERPAARGVVAAKVTNVDAAGNRLLALATEAHLGAVNLVVLLVSDERGILDGYGGRLTLAEMARRMEGLTGGMQGLHLVDAPADYVRQAMLSAHDLNRSALQPVPAEFYHWREAIGEPQRRYEREIVYDEVNAAAVRWNPQYLDMSGELLDLPEFIGWRLPERDVVQVLREVSRTRESRLVLPGTSQEEHERRAIDRFVDGYFTAPVRLKYKLRLERTAYVLARLGRLLDARRAVAAALALDPASNVPVSKQPFVVAMAEETLAIVDEEETKKRKLPGGLVLPPR